MSPIQLVIILDLNYFVLKKNYAKLLLHEEHKMFYTLMKVNYLHICYPYLTNFAQLCIRDNHFWDLQAFFV